ncbi:hypothetical protein [Robertmurraya kyonggiensis]|uniref:DUF2157 domain-containing protein n=1 Tax=Robertmurraya kyonggiensis TaxID=1037680 RepID=A0A4V5P400_9BACI|nr:hypothetical protein [Robertmurraya kyonggiensis]TKC18810.1 hypothetical protein FA727_04430 [Robertmurraya kyonggiensis]
MQPLSREERKRIVQQELVQLQRENYITSSVYEGVTKAHHQFYADLEAKEQQESISTAPVVQVTTEKKLIPQIKKPEKIKKTEEQIRERNITWLLNLGVILLLIGGLYVATSNWATMSSVTKAGAIGLISILFYGIAFVSKRILKIDKTAFAFIVLASLFLPIFLLSIGWFQLSGTYLSIYGEGRYLFGFLSSIVLLPVYVLIAKKLKSRLFVWFSYITLTIAMGFLLATFKLGEDSFFLGMMLFQAVLIFFYHRIKGIEKYKIFTKEFVYYAQFNLILTTLLMLVLFNSHGYLGFNMILTAVIYLSMVYVSGRKEFHFVFSATLVYGAYQLIENTVPNQLSPLLFAGIGFIFLLVPRVLGDHYPWKKIFTYTSSVVSGCAFLFITFQAITINWGNASVVLLLAYVVIAGNFLYLSSTTKKILFRYLTAVFLSVAMFEGVLLVDQEIDLQPFVLFVFLIGCILFAGIGVYVKGRLLESIKQPARDVGWAYMFLSIFIAFTMYEWWELGVMLVLISVCAYLTLEKETRLEVKPLAEWIIPLSLGLGVVSFAEELRGFWAFYEQELGIATHGILASIVLIFASVAIKNNQLKRNSFYVAQGFYTLALIAATFLPINGEWVRPLTFIGGIVMYSWLYRVTKLKYVTYVVSGISLMTYFTILSSIGELGRLHLIGGAIILLAVAFYIKNRERHYYQAFALVGHVYLLIALLLAMFIFGKESVWSFLISLVIYAVSTKLVEREWKRKVFLYSAFTMVFAIFATAIEYGENLDGEYAYLLTSVVLTGFWLLANASYKKRMIYYLVAFSLLGILAFLNMYPYKTIPFVVTVLYAIGLLLILHRSKWDFVAILPSLFIYMGTLQYLIYQPFASIHELWILAGLGMAFLIAGKWCYRQLYEQHEGEVSFSVDAYTLIAVFFFGTMYGFEQPTIWSKLLPGLLIVLTLWLQRKRVSVELQWIPTFLAGAYLLQPYYALLGEVSIHPLLVKEAYVLPFIMLLIYLQFCLKGKYKEVVTYLQWGILLVVSGVLIIDGLETSTIYDALIVGGLSLASLLAGVFLKIKSYFFVGSGVLLLNVFLQTRPYWGNLPWWAYLLIAGSILIGVASSNEWNKQKAARGEKTFISTLKESAIKMWKQWK